MNTPNIESNQEHYEDYMVDSLGSKVKISAGTVASTPEKPNEDTYSIIQTKDSLTLAIFDGTTSLKPIAGLQGMTGARYASNFLKSHLDTVLDLEPIDALLRLNGELLKAATELGGSLTDTHSLPTSIATLLSIKKGQRFAKFAHVGDSYGIVYLTDGRSTIFTEDRNLAFDARIFALIESIATERHITPREARNNPRVNAALIEMYIGRNNNPNGKGTGLLNGDPNLKLYIQSGIVDLQNAEGILLGSDGLTPPGWDLGEENVRHKMLAAIKDGGFQKLFALKHEAEDSDPDWLHVRYKHSDDATGIYLGLK